MDVAKVSGSLGWPASVAPNATPDSVKEAGGLSFERAPDSQTKPSDTSGLARLELETQVSEVLSRVQMVQRDLNFKVDDSTGQVVIKVIDGQSGKLVRQIPSEELLELAERFEEMRSLMQGTKA